MPPSPSLPPARTAPDPAVRNPVGTHVKVGRGLVEEMLPRAAEIGAEVLQLFAGNPRGWRPAKGNPAKDEAFRSAATEQGVRVVVHAPYLVNLGSPTPLTYERSVAAVAHNLARAADLGAEGVVVHTGSCVDEGGFDTALRQVREGLLPILDAVSEAAGPDGGPWLLLESTAGQGRSLCATVEQHEAYLAALDFHPRLGLCLDTCHLFAAGEPLDEPGGTTSTVDRLLAIAGEGRLRLVHANDSMDVRGAFKDRHQRIGEGHIGVPAFAELLAHPATDGVPFVLETPGSRDADDPQIPLLKRLREEVAAEAAPTGAAR